MKDKQSKGSGLQVPCELMDRIRVLQKELAPRLGLRTKAPQYMVISEAISLLEQRRVK